MTYPLYQPALKPRSTAKPMPVPDPDWRHGLLVRVPNWLGDCLMALPAVYQLRQRIPNGGRLTILCRASVAGFWKTIPWVDTVVEMEKRAGRRERQILRTFQAGVAIVLPNSFSAALDVWRCGIPLRLGRAGRGRSLLLTKTLPAWNAPKGEAEFHQAGQYLDFPALLGWSGWDTEIPPLQPPDAHAIATAIGMTAGAGPWLVLAPGAAYGPAKQWPAASFAETASLWCRNTGGSVAVTGTEKDRELSRAILDTSSVRGLDLCGKTNLQQLMAVLANADKLVVNDSGAMHLAAALGRSGVAIFGSTDPVATGPVGGHWIIAREKQPCAPCFKRECPRQDAPYACLKAVTPAQVFEALQALS